MMKPRSPSRRTVLARAGLGAAAVALLPRPARARDYGPDAPPARYPDPDVLALDKRWAKLKVNNTPILRMHHGMLWAEGPAWNGVGGYLVWSDIPNDCQMRWLNDDGHVSVARRGSGFSNGNTFDFQGRQLSCEHGNRRVVRYEPNGGVTVLADKFDGKPLNAPNDIVVHPDGAVWFTDPGYGALMDYEGNRGEMQLKEAVYRLDPKTGRLDKVTDEMWKPNGICFSPDYKRLYVADTGSTHYPQAKHVVMTWEIDGGTRLKNGRVFTNMAYKGKSAFADGIRCDVEGNLYAATGWQGEGFDGVHVFAPDGARIGLIRLPETASNVCFGGPKRNRLFITASQSLYAVYLETRGAHIA